ncbi:hypothetical protein HYDPIDRAFT_31458 [Hydnomerulius pinastri MD-312]|uniref:Unplaced genomic scaffold scaffold_29, whole genome shotgun sequence n=1 Tax=Hydnomerulius pinastri MD-312 TaxID=994086 RepID=A0A0C9V6W4_9AGAM|nr:hypothetical protein HYDPIDRAFT_31458 [Hydnomerulius pinastri MD-312]
MTMIKSLGNEFSNVAPSLLLLKSLDKEEIKLPSWLRRPTGDVVLTLLVTLPSLPPPERAGAAPMRPRVKDALKTSQAQKKTGKRSKNANKASEASQPSPTSSSASDTANSASTPNSATPQSAQSSMEFAGNASLHSLTPSDPLCYSQIDADIDCNADTGATLLI